MLEKLNDREKEIFDLLCENLTNAEIALKIGMSEPTIKKDMRNIYAKMDILSGNESRNVARRRLILWAKEEGYIKDVVKTSNGYTAEQIRQAAKTIFPDKRIRVVNELISFLEYE